MRLNLPFIGPEELRAVESVLATGYLTQGARAAEFERLVAAYVGSAYGFATSSCTTALHLSLVALGIKPGDEVVVPDFTFPATANAVVQLGATPVLADIDPRTYNLTAQTLAGAMTDRTRAVVVVHAFGQPAELDPLLEITRNRGVPLVEDAACALGGRYKGSPVGSFGTVGCFSFHPRKIITTGEGGVIVTNDRGLSERIAILRSHGGVRDGLYLSFVEAGFNYRLSDIHAAIGVVQMARIEQIISSRRRLAAYYGTALEQIGVQPPFEHPDVQHPFQSYVVQLPEGVDRDEVIRGLAARGIETTLGTYSLHNQPFFQRVYGYKAGQLPESDVAFRRTLTLPLHPQMEQADVYEVSQGLDCALQEAARRGGAETSGQGGAE